MANEPGNPYAPPAADVNAGPLPVQLEQLPTAGVGARLLNFIIDYIVQLALGTIVMMVIHLLGAGADWSEASSTIYGLVTMIAYYVLFEAMFGWTVGKLVTGTRVIRADGNKPRVPQIIGRTFARFIPFEPFSVLSGTGWHDSMSGTRVVRVRR